MIEKHLDHNRHHTSAHCLGLIEIFCNHDQPAGTTSYQKFSYKKTRKDRYENDSCQL